MALAGNRDTCSLVLVVDWGVDPIDRVKIAAVTDDGRTVSAHFGRARSYLVCTLEGGRVVAQELREKAGCGGHGNGHGHGHGHEPGHGHEHEAEHRHDHDHGGMLAAIPDVQVVVARGMGRGAFTALQAAGIAPVVTDEATVDAAVRAYLAGTLKNHVERLH